MHLPEQNKHTHIKRACVEARAESYTGARERERKRGERGELDREMVKERRSRACASSEKRERKKNKVREGS